MARRNLHTNKAMISIEEFELTVKKYFNYLIEDFGFVYKGATSQPYSYYVKYTKETRLVRIDLAYRHDFIEVNIFDKIDKVEPTTQNFKYSVSLSSLMYKNSPSLEFGKKYEALMPNRIGLEKSVEILSQFLIKYAKEILHFKTWISTNDCK